MILWEKYSSSHSIFSNDSPVVWKYTTVLIINSWSTFRQKIEKAMRAHPVRLNSTRIGTVNHIAKVKGFAYKVRATEQTEDRSSGRRSFKKTNGKSSLRDLIKKKFPGVKFNKVLNEQFLIESEVPRG